MDRYVNK